MNCSACRLEHLRINLLIKRCMDIILSSIVLILLTPVILIVFFLIKVTSKGPIFFKQTRIGLGYRKFVLFKFRTMTVSDVLDGYEVQENGEIKKRINDPRITKLGRILRKSSFDEIPQLYNILKGEMSLVGPRPLVPFMLDHLNASKFKRCEVKPGLTGLWQIRDRIHSTSADSMIFHDLEYIDTFSVLLDLKILIATVPKVISGEGAI